MRIGICAALRMPEPCPNLGRRKDIEHSKKGYTKYIERV